MNFKFSDKYFAIFVWMDKKLNINLLSTFVKEMRKKSFQEMLESAENRSELTQQILSVENYDNRR